ncbi:MAG: TIGR03668 family PPOX class F420-dependent oxidoreductase [Pseudonocardiales bacterium]|nr:MAG: TIGR03668 family PPOX class F420-dependent oxidoreductase [Pseudonocardiales bacterium]
MRMGSDWARARFDGERVARLATADDFGRPHLVPVVFAVDGAATIYTAVDAKPKSSTALRRLANIAENPQVSLLVDYYDEDWTLLWWARADGVARVHADGTAALGPLIGRYEQYRTAPPDGPFIEITVQRWSGWSAASS